MTVLAQTGGLNDIFVEASTGTFKLSTGKEAYGLIVADTIRNLAGELQLDIERGVPYHETIWTRNSGLEAWKDAVRDLVNEYEFVKEIDTFETTITNDGHLTYTLQITTQDNDDVTVSQTV